MTRIGIRELNQHTSRYVAKLKAGETIELTEHGRLIGKLVPATRGESTLDRLAAQGKVTPATVDPRSLPPLPPPEDDVNAADALIAMRAEEPW